MNNKIVFFNTGWMDFYRGISNDKIKGGGKHVETQGWGGEMYNFKEYRGRFYGYVQPKIDRKYNNPSTIKLEKMGAGETDMELKNVTVVWTAKDPINKGTFIVGWYLNATVFRYYQSAPNGSDRKYKNNKLGYFVSTKSENAKLLPRDERIVQIRRQEKDWMGQSNVWYADKNPDFVKLIQAYINEGKIPVGPKRPGSKKGYPRQMDPFKRLLVERRAVEVTTNYYKKLAYTVESFEKDNLGWDLIASNDKVQLKLEVKGLSGDTILAELTPNEYDNLKADLPFYRLCIVTEALTKKPNLKIFAYSDDYSQWVSEDGTIIKFTERISARISI